MKPIARSFFHRDVDIVARELVGQWLVRDVDGDGDGDGDGERVVLRITECEAYGPETDTAAHSRAGLTARTKPMFGPPGHAYIYLCYGIHWMLNLVTSPVGTPKAILIRSCDVVEGLDVVVRRRHVRRPSSPKAMAALVAGPGKVTQALAIDLAFNNHDVCAPGSFFVARARRRKSDAPLRVVRGARVGIDYAELHDREAIRRYALADCDAVTQRALLR